MKQKRRMYLFIILLIISAIITCFLIFYYSKRTVEYSLEQVISYPENKSSSFYERSPIWNKMPDEYKMDQLIRCDSGYFYVKEHLPNLDFTKNSYMISSRRKIISVHWSPHLSDKFYNITDCQFLPVHVEFDTVMSNSIYIYKLKKNKYRLMAPY